MFLNRLILRDFKNISAAEIAFSPKVNCIYGSNGAGKTNLLDAVYYLSMTKSYFSSSDQYVYAYGAGEATLCGFYQMDGGTEDKISAAVRRGGEKTFRRGAKTYARFSEHIGLLPVVMVSPLDGALVNDAGEERRKYLNFILSQIDREYLRHIQAYNQLLLQRNKLLKSDLASPMLLDTLSERMEPHASY
ncbi:MAG: DNA replication/repair protein RecF, partial [Bacteroidales bacterium]|nr:DNA replication/repair protein RecF [Bacteroidales bacterium]